MFYLDIKNLMIIFGGLIAIDDLDLKTKKGEIHAIIGPNGAGKTTLINAITGIYKPNKGTINFNGENLIKLKPHIITKKGIARTFQNIELFSKMNVLDTVLVGRHIHIKTGIFASSLSLRRSKREEDLGRERALEILNFMGLSSYTYNLATSLSFGQQRLLEIARALVTEPKLLLLDEPAAGMNVQEIEELSTLLQIIKGKWGIDILLIEHVMRLVMNISDRITVLDFGKKIAEGPPKEIKSNSKVIEAYLGEGENSVKDT
jgi:branched-chain amino acid transport system ATP-binding protein